MRIVAQLIGTLLVVGFVLKYWWLIALVLAAVAVWKHGPGWWARHQATVPPSSADSRRSQPAPTNNTNGYSRATRAAPTGTGAELLVPV